MKASRYLLPVTWPLSALWGVAVSLRSRAYGAGLLRQRRLNGIVISIGNLTVGGTGKTPMVLWIMERLAAQGECAAILTRGYAGFMKSGEIKDRSLIFRAPSGPDFSPAEISTRLPDEVKLLVSRLASPAIPPDGPRPPAFFGVGANRYASGKKLEREGVHWFVLDDGFQHLRLFRDVNITLLDGRNPFGNGRLLPAGILREPPSALRRADMIVITRRCDAPEIEEVVHLCSSAPVFYAVALLDSIRRLDSHPSSANLSLSPADYSAHRFFAFCGIGNPEAFWSDARSWGLDVCGVRSFPDHHRYSARDGAELRQLAMAAGATALLCTEKDAWNGAGARGDGALPVFSAQISFHLPRGDEFWRELTQIAARNRSHGGRDNP